MGVLISRYFALLKNEYMQVKLGLSILVAVHIMYQLIYFFSVTYLEDNPLGILIALTFFFFSYLYPVYFLYSLHSSSKKRSFDTVHLLAVPKWLPVFFRFLIVLYAGIIMQCLTFSFYFYSIVTDFKESFSPMFYDPRFYAGTLISMISVPFVTLSIACVIWGVIQAVKRYRAITAVAVGIFAHAGYSQLFKNKDTGIFCRIHSSYSMTYINSITRLLQCSLAARIFLSALYSTIAMPTCKNGWIDLHHAIIFE